MSALGRGRNGSASNSSMWAKTRSRRRASRARRNDNASSERRTSNFVEGMESGLLQDPQLALVERAFLRDFHETSKDPVVALSLSPRVFSLSRVVFRTGRVVRSCIIGHNLAYLLMNSSGVGENAASFSSARRLLSRPPARSHRLVRLSALRARRARGGDLRPSPFRPGGGRPPRRGFCVRAPFWHAVPGGVRPPAGAARRPRPRDARPP